jgi:flagellar hook-length control protein FliK
VTVNLNPPELGKISIKFEKNGDEVSGRLEVEKLHTKNQIDLNLSQIIQNLQDSGVQVKRVEVVLQEQPLENQQEFAGQAQPDWGGRRDFESNYGDNGVHATVSDNIQFVQNTVSKEYLSDKSVNILV